MVQSGALRNGPFKKSRSSDLLIEQLTEQIRSGMLSPGERLPTERSLMERFGVSRWVVREAIAALATQGLLHTRPGHRPIVTKPDFGSALGSLTKLVDQLIADDADGIWHLFESRIFIEAGLCRWMALSGRKEDILELQEALARNREAIGNPAEFNRTDAAFHHVLYKARRNPIYPAVHGAYVEWLSRYWQQAESSPQIHMMLYSGHHAIFTAIVERDPDGAEQALSNHLRASWEHIRASFAFPMSAGAK